MPDHCLTRGGITQYQVRVTVAVKVSYCSYARCRKERRGWPDIIDVFLAVECGCIRNVRASVVRNDCDVIADFLLIWITDERVKRDAERDVWRPGISAVEAVRIKELRSGVVRSATRIVPGHIDSAVGRDRQRAEPVPFRMINWVVIDPTRRAERAAPVCAAYEHHVAASGEAGGLHTG